MLLLRMQWKADQAKIAGAICLSRGRQQQKRQRRKAWQNEALVCLGQTPTHPPPPPPLPFCHWCHWHPSNVNA